MNKTRFNTLLAGILVLCVAPYTMANVVNIDVEAGAPGDMTHVGADGPLSTSGVLWNAVIGGVGMNNLMDEFAGPSPFDIVYMSPGPGLTFSDPGINDLQDSGAFDAFEIQDLLPGQMYEIAAYVAHNGGFNFQDANGTRGFFFGNPAADGWSLPGTEGNGGDFFLVGGAMPYDLGGGVYGVRFQLDGSITGLQISGPVPEPAGLLLLGVGGIALLRRQQR